MLCLARLCSPSPMKGRGNRRIIVVTGLSGFDTHLLNFNWALFTLKKVVFSVALEKQLMFKECYLQCITRQLFTDLVNT